MHSEIGHSEFISESQLYIEPSSVHEILKQVQDDVHMFKMKRANSLWPKAKKYGT